MLHCVEHSTRAQMLHLQLGTAASLSADGGRQYGSGKLRSSYRKGRKDPSAAETLIPFPSPGITVAVMAFVMAFAPPLCPHPWLSIYQDHAPLHVSEVLRHLSPIISLLAVLSFSRFLSHPSRAQIQAPSLTVCLTLDRFIYFCVLASSSKNGNNNINLSQGVCEDHVG